MTELVKFFFTLQHTIKLYHWATTRYSRHVASDKLHSDLLPLIDKFMEIYLAKVGTREPVTESLTITIESLSDSQMVDTLEEAVATLLIIGSNNDQLRTFIDEVDTDLLNIRDEMVGVINKTLYLFTLN